MMTAATRRMTARLIRHLLVLCHLVSTNRSTGQLQSPAYSSALAPNR